MSKRKNTINEATRNGLERGDIAEQIARKAAFLGRAAADPHCPPKRRQEYEKRLVAAFEALQAPAWLDSVGTASLMQIFDSAARFLASPECDTTEDREVSRAVERIRGVMGDLYAPDEWHGREPDPDLVRQCVRMWQRKPGRPSKSEAASPRDGKAGATKYGALHALLVQLEISNASTPEATKQAVARIEKRRARRSEKQ